MKYILAVVSILILATSSGVNASAIDNALQANGNAMENDCKILSDIILSLGFSNSVSKHPEYDNLIEAKVNVPASITKKQVYELVYSINIKVKSSKFSGQFSPNIDGYVGQEKVFTGNVYYYTNLYSTDDEIAKSVVDTTIFWSAFDTQPVTYSAPTVSYSSPVKAQPTIDEVNRYFSYQLSLPVQFKVNVDSYHVGISYDANSGYNANPEVIELYRTFVQSTGYKGYLRVAGFSNANGQLQAVYDDTVYA